MQPSEEQLLYALDLKLLPVDHFLLGFLNLRPAHGPVCLLLLGDLLKDPFQNEIRDVTHVVLVQDVDLNRP